MNAAERVLHVAGSPVLRTVCRAVGAHEFGELAPLLRAMKRTLREEDGQGLAAPQLGESLCVFLLAAERSSAQPLVVVNPRVLRRSKAVSVDWESCLSVPGYAALVERPRSVEVSFQTAGGKAIERVLRGQAARVFQHELDHLNGRLYTERMFAPSFALQELLLSEDERAPLERAYATASSGSAAGDEPRPHKMIPSNRPTRVRPIR